MPQKFHKKINLNFRFYFIVLWGEKKKGKQTNKQKNGCSASSALSYILFFPYPPDPSHWQTLIPTSLVMHKNCGK